MDNTILKTTNISKSFSGVKVLNNIDFDLKRGEVHVLIGENGAGKSTLMKILTGIYQRDSGEILLKNNDGKFEKLEVPNPRYALEKGISMVFQEFNLMNNLSIAENIYIGYEPKKHGIVDFKKMNEEALKQLQRVGLDVSPKIKVGSLSVAEKQCVEIAKCLSQNARIIILDEPTSSLSEKEVRVLFELIRNLKKNGVSIVYISHRMNEIFEIGDRITVFRDGYLIDTLNVSETNEDELVKLIIGREFDNSDSTMLKTKKELMLQVENVSVGRFDSKISFDAYAGEILGIFGLIGSGRTELARVIFGIDSIKEGKIKKNGNTITLRSAYDAIRNGIGLIPEDRKELGLITMHDVRDNISLIKLKEFPWILSSRANETKTAEEYIKKTSIATRGPKQLTKYLSGGNQQKVVISKWLAVDMDVIILDEPTRGVDVGAKREIYEIIRELAVQGKCIIMISSDLPEILRVCQRVLVMHDGAITLDEYVENLDQEKIMRAALS